MVGKGKAKKKNDQKNQSPDKKDPKNTRWYWDCGQTGHRRNKGPEHFKFKPKKDSEAEEPSTQKEQERNDNGSQ